MATTTTIRVSSETRDLLKALSARRRSSAGETVAKLVHDADDDLLLADAEAAFARLAEDPERIAAYRTENDGLGEAFDAPIPDW